MVGPLRTQTKASSKNLSHISSADRHEAGSTSQAPRLDLAQQRLPCASRPPPRGSCGKSRRPTPAARACTRLAEGRRRRAPFFVPVLSCWRGGAGRSRSCQPPSSSAIHQHDVKLFTGGNSTGTTTTTTIIPARQTMEKTHPQHGQPRVRRAQQAFCERRPQQRQFIDARHQLHGCGPRGHCEGSYQQPSMEQPHRE